MNYLIIGSLLGALGVSFTVTLALLTIDWFTTKPEDKARQSMLIRNFKAFILLALISYSWAIAFLIMAGAI